MSGQGMDRLQFPNINLPGMASPIPSTPVPNGPPAPAGRSFADRATARSVPAGPNPNYQYNTGLGTLLSRLMGRGGAPTQGGAPAPQGGGGNSFFRIQNPAGMDFWKGDEMDANPDYRGGGAQPLPTHARDPRQMDQFGGSGGGGYSTDGGPLDISAFQKGHMFTNQDLSNLYGDRDPSLSMGGGGGSDVMAQIAQMLGGTGGAPQQQQPIPLSGKSQMPWDRDEGAFGGVFENLMSRYKELQGKMGQTMLRGKKNAYVQEMDMLGRLMGATMDETGWKRDAGLGQLDVNRQEMQDKAATNDIIRRYAPGKALADIAQSIGAGNQSNAAADKDRFQMTDAYYNQLNRIASNRSGNSGQLDEASKIRLNGLEKQKQVIMGRSVNGKLTPADQQDWARIEAEQERILGTGGSSGGGDMESFLNSLGQ